MTRPLLAVFLACAGMAIAGPAVMAAGVDPAWRHLAESPDSLRAARARYEQIWNDLFAADLEAFANGSSEAKSLRALASQLAAQERRTLGTTIASQAMEARARWTRRDAGDRARAWRDETAGWGPAMRGEPARAESLLSSAQTTYGRLGDHRREAWAAGRLGGVAMNRGNYVRADSLQIHALELRRQWGDSTMVSNTLNDLGGITLNLGRVTEAVSFLEEARAIRERLGDPRLGSTLNLLGTAYSRLGRSREAGMAFRAALSSPAAPPAHLDMLLNYGEHLRSEGRLRAAEDTLKLALEQAVEGDDDARKASAMARLSDVASDAGRFSDCIELRTSLVEMAKADQDTLAIARALSRRGNAWNAVRRPAEARVDLIQAREFAVAYEDSSLLGRCHADLALASLLEGDSTASRQLTRAALDVATHSGDRSLMHDAYVQRGNIDCDAGRFQEARAAFDSALALTSERDGAQGLGDRINLSAADILLGRLDQAERELLDVVTAADARGLMTLAPTARADLAHIAWVRRDTARALAMSRDNLGSIERLRTLQRAEDPLLGLFADHADEFDAMLQYLVRTATRTRDDAPVREAFAWAERARARVLLDRIAARRGSAEPALLDLDSVQARLAPDDALLEYAIGDSLGIAWFVRRGDIRWFELPNRRHIGSRVALVRQRLGDANDAGDARGLAALDSLGSLLVGRFASSMDGVRRITVVPDGPLCLVPFECLRVRGRFLVERHTISYAPSASVRFAPAAPPTDSLVVALGDPAFAPDAGAVATVVTGASDGMRSATLAPLPFTAKEIDRLARLAPPRPVAVLTGRRATLSGLLAVDGLARASIVHLATHGEADDLEPERSSLWFAPESTGADPGRLSARDVASLDLGVDLITLAACESGLGHLERAEGVLGFTRAFLAAGAHSVVASLWKVSDAASSRLMSDYYEGLLVRNMSRDEALAAAKRALIAIPAVRSPFYWGAFVLVGESGPLDHVPPGTLTRHGR